MLTTSRRIKKIDVKRNKKIVPSWIRRKNGGREKLNRGQGELESGGFPPTPPFFPSRLGFGRDPTTTPRTKGADQTCTTTVSARKGFRVGRFVERASCTVPRLQVGPLVSNNEDLNSLNRKVAMSGHRSCRATPRSSICFGAQCDIILRECRFTFHRIGGDRFSSEG